MIKLGGMVTSIVTPKAFKFTGVTSCINGILIRMLDVDTFELFDTNPPVLTYAISGVGVKIICFGLFDIKINKLYLKYLNQTQKVNFFILKF